MSEQLTFTEQQLAEAINNVGCYTDLGAELIAASVFANHSAQALNMVDQVGAALKIGQVPFAIECGLSNGDGTYSVHIKRYPLPSYLEPHKDRPVKLLYTAPPAQASAWVPVSVRLPESGQTVLAYYLNGHGKGRRIRAQHIKAWTIEAGDVADPDTECVEYSEQMDCYYLLEGWYECIDNWDDYTRVAVNEGPITHWMPLPAAPSPSPSDKARGER